MTQLPESGEWVRWRDPQQAKMWSWDKTFGEGPFLVVGVVDHSAYGHPNGILVMTMQGEQEISETWLARQETSGP